jgi:hypothetical protein
VGGAIKTFLSICAGTSKNGSHLVNKSRRKSCLVRMSPSSLDDVQTTMCLSLVSGVGLLANDNFPCGSCGMSPGLLDKVGCRTSVHWPPPPAWGVSESTRVENVIDCCPALALFSQHACEGHLLPGSLMSGEPISCRLLSRDFGLQKPKDFRLPLQRFPVAHRCAAGKPGNGRF